MADQQDDLRPLTFFDVETTGLSREDRVVSLGVLHVVNVPGFRSGFTEATGTHLIFNPDRPSHPRARAVHGYADDVLARQDSFAEHAADLREFFEHGGVLAAHNVSFDRRFIMREFELAGSPLPKAADFYCTMMAYRRQYVGERSGLDAVLKHMQLPPRTGHHGAFADAWYAMAIFRWLQGLPIPNLADLPTQGPLNLRMAGKATPPVPPKPVSLAPPLPAAEDKQAFAAAVQLLSPLATIMMHVAHADGTVMQAEIEAISLLMHTMLTGRPHGLSDAQQQDLLAHLVDVTPTPDDLLVACQGIVRDENMRNSVSGWVRQVTFADGDPSTAEKAAILQVADKMREARRSLG